MLVIDRRKKKKTELGVEGEIVCVSNKRREKQEKKRKLGDGRKKRKRREC